MSLLSERNVMSTNEKRKQPQQGQRASDFGPDRGNFLFKAGQTVKLTLNHTGKLPKNAMGHNFVLIAGGTDMASFAQVAMQASDNEYIPKKGCSSTYQAHW